MKKITALVVSLLMASAVFAQNIPVGRSLISVVYYVANAQKWAGVYKMFRMTFKMILM